MVSPVEPGDSWKTPFVEYLRHGTLPEDTQQKRQLRIKAAQYTMVGDELFRRSASRPLLRCLDATEAAAVLQELHSGTCGVHSAGRTLAHKALTQGYYWPTMKKDASDLARSCLKCQKHSHLERRPVTELCPITSPWPFAQWGLDILGQFTTARGGFKHIFVATDYFTKWPEAQAVTRIESSDAVEFIKKFVVCRFGVPAVIITDNGSQFTSSEFRQYCSGLGIQLRFAAAAHPQCNGLVELTNRNILNGIKKRLDDAKSLWAEHLPFVLWGLRTTYKTSTGRTPFQLAYGTEAMVPVELSVPTHRVAVFDPAANDACLSHEIDLLEEDRNETAIKAAAFQQSMKKYYDRKVHHRDFKVGDLVLRSIASTSTRVKKLSPTWEGPFEITEVCAPGAYRIRWRNGIDVPSPWSGFHLRRYYE